MSETNIQTLVDSADQLIGKLEQIHRLWSELPTVEEVRQLTEAMDSLAASAQEAQDRCDCDGFPTEDALSDLAKSADSLATSLREATEAYAADDFPNEDALSDLAKSADSVASSLKQAGDRLDSDALVAS